MFAAILLGLTGAALLSGIYRGVEARWPDEYLGMTHTFGLRVRQTLVRFLAYRFVPHTAAVLVTAVSAERVAEDAFAAPVAGGICGAIGIALTNLRALVEGVLRPRALKVAYVEFHLCVTVALAVATWGVIAARGPLSVIVPQPEAILEALWGGAIALAGGGLLFAMLKRRGAGAPRFDAQYWVDRFERQTSLEKRDRAFGYVRKWGGDPLLFESLMIAEVMQRPGWIRRLELLAANLGRRTTVGMMQVDSRLARTEDRSLRVAAFQLRGQHGWTFENAVPAPEWGAVWGVATRHNGEGVFAETVWETYQHLLGGAIRPDAGWPGFFIETRRYVDSVGLRGVTSASAVAMVSDADAEVDRREGHRAVYAQRPRHSPEGKWSFELRVPIRATEILIAAVTPSGRRVALLNLAEGRLVRAQAFAGSRSSVDRDIEMPWTIFNP